MAAIGIPGRLGGAIEIRYTPSGAKVASFSVAEDTGWGDRKNTTWFRVSAFGKLADRLESSSDKGYLNKGDNVFIRGEFSLREYQKGDGTKGYSADVSADDVKIIFAPKGDSAPGYGGGSTDEVPF